MDDFSNPPRTQPMLDDFSRPWWRASRDGRLLVQRCAVSGRVQWPPRPRMLPDWDDPADWAPTTGRGTVYSFSIVHRSSYQAPSVPYVIAIIELEGGGFMMSNIATANPEQLRIGMAVRVSFEQLGEDLGLPVFTADVGAASSAAA